MTILLLMYVQCLILMRKCSIVLQVEEIGVQQLTSRVSVFDFEVVLTQYSSRAFLIVSLAKTATWKIAS